MAGFDKSTADTHLPHIGGNGKRGRSDSLKSADSYAAEHDVTDYSAATEGNKRQFRNIFRRFADSSDEVMLVTVSMFGGFKRSPYKFAYPVKVAFPFRTNLYVHISIHISKIDAIEYMGTQW